MYAFCDVQKRKYSFNVCDYSVGAGGEEVGIPPFFLKNYNFHVSKLIKMANNVLAHPFF